MDKKAYFTFVYLGCINFVAGSPTICNADSNLTVKHLLIECPHWANQRILYFHRKCGLTIRHVLGDGDVTFEGALYKYILSTNQMNNL